ncbi:MAG TPA: ABC transporter permease [Pirellulales bacterium]|jgi:ribose transport system permease protein
MIARFRSLVALAPGPNRVQLLTRFQSVIALGVVLLGLSIASGSWTSLVNFWSRFLTVDNGLTVLRQISINLCLSIGMTVVILSGGIDLSVGSVLALASAMAAGLLKSGVALPAFGVVLEPTVLGTVIIGMAVGLALGWFNGAMITWFRLPPFIATLSMMGIARGLTMLWTRGANIPDLGDAFGFLGTGKFLGIPMLVWISAVLAGVFAFIMRRTCFGRFVYAVGGNEKAAKLSGIYVNKIKRWVYTIGGGMAGVAGLLLASQLNAATPNAGTSYELDSIAAVVIGGTSLSGGRGSIVGTVLGCLIIGVLNNGLDLQNVPSDWQKVVKGFVIYLAVAIDQLGRKSD